MCKIWLTLLEISITCCYLFYFLFFCRRQHLTDFHFPLKNLCTSKRKQTVFFRCCICMKKRWKKKQQNAKSQKNVYSNCLKFILCHFVYFINKYLGFSILYKCICFCAFLLQGVVGRGSAIYRYARV